MAVVRNNECDLDLSRHGSVPRLSQNTGEESGSYNQDTVSRGTERSENSHQTVAEGRHVSLDLQEQSEDGEHHERSNNPTEDSRHEPRELPDGETDSYPSAANRTAKKKRVLTYHIRTTALAILGLVMAGLFSVPVTMFVTKTSKNSESAVAECIAEEYTGEVCQSVLAARQSCIPSRGNSTEVFVSLVQQQQVLLEQQLLILLEFTTPSPECEAELLPFLCVEAFSGFCDSEGAVHRTTRQECERVTTRTCAAEFRQILPLLEARGFELSCDAFPDSSAICNNLSSQREGSEEDTSSGQMTTVSGFGDTTTESRVNINCSEGFFPTGDFLCVPECGEWWPLSTEQVKTNNIVTLTAGAVGISLCVVVVFLSCLNYKTVFTFPGVFIFYQMLSSLVYGVVFLLNYIDFTALLCRSRNLVESLMPGNETPLCILSAISLIYISHQVALWWMFHLFMVFWAVFWPFKYNYWKKSGYLKYIHVVMVLTALILPSVPVIICFKLDGYVLYFLIRPDCVARNSQAAFYSHVVPLILAVVVGLYLLVLIFWKFLSEEWMANKRTKRQVELKILFLLCSYIIIWSDVIGVIVASLIEAEDYRNTLVEHFTCQASGSQECQRDVFQRFDVVSKVIAYSLVGLYPGIFLIYFAKRSPCCRKSNSTVTSGASVISRKNIT